MRAVYNFEDIIGESKEINRVISYAKSISSSPSTVLIEGESGTGKELFARAIHFESQRCDAPFIAVNCASIPDNLLESEFFGYEGGAFSGAKREGQMGKFELANGGTIFLDEIGDLPLHLQPKILRVLQEQSFTKIGGKEEICVDVRIIAATNRELETMVKHGQFRQDLYYRLNVFNVRLIPLRERPEDIELCADYFLQRLNDKNQRMNKSFDKEFINLIKDYNWPGNVRELENVIQRAYYLSKDEVINYSFIPEYINGNIKGEEIKDKEEKSKPPTLEEMERKLIIQALKYCNGNVINASKIIGVGKSTLYRKIEKYRLEEVSKWEK
jgi:transcriptional regulator with PAS, ATPase and Fis domain